MRPLGTWVVIGALALIALFATRDALRSDDAPASEATTTLAKRRTTAPPRPPRAPVIPGRESLTRRLAALGAHAVLEVTGGTCVHYLLGVPSLRWSPPQGLPGQDCGFEPATLRDGSTGIAARQVDPNTIEASSEIWSHRFRGVSPAFRPGGTLTFVRDGRLYEWTVRCGLGARTVTFRGNRDVDRCLQRVDGAPGRLLEVAWISATDFAAISGSQNVASLLVVRDGRARSLFRAIGATMRGLRVSPRGRYFATRIDGYVFVFDSGRRGNLAVPPDARLATAVAWSDDDRFTALASQDRLYVYPSADVDKAVTVPVGAIQLEWR